MLRTLASIALAVMLAGCEAKGELVPLFLRSPQPPPIVAAPREAEPMCQARARHFVGTVPVPCAAIAEETRD